MTTMVEIPRDPTNWTVDDLARLPDDGNRYELLDGQLLVSPAPVKRHQRAVGALHLLLSAAAPPELTVYLAPTDWQPDRRNSFQPDLLVIVDEDPDAKNVTETPVLAVEVLSPSTRRVDLVGKRAKYESSGVASYWIIDPDVPSAVAWDLVDGGYQVAGEANGPQKLDLERPFPVSLVPELLVRSHRR